MPFGDDQPSFGFDSQKSSRSRMSGAHRHDDIEFNYAPTEMTYRIDGTEVRIPGRRVAAFWAARPHQLIDDAPEDWVHWLTVPLSAFLAWSTPDGMSGRLLRGEVLLLEDHTTTPPIMRLEQWSHDLSAGGAWSAGTARLEIEAYLRRLSFDSSPQSAPLSSDDDGGRRSMLAGRMAAYLSAHSAEPVSVADVAAAVHLHPGYAMTVFRRGVGATIGSYLTQCRIAHAQRLLLTSDAAVREIGYTVGFQSTSQFYDRFRAACGTAPAAYRKEASRSQPPGVATKRVEHGGVVRRPRDP